MAAWCPANGSRARRSGLLSPRRNSSIRAMAISRMTPQHQAPLDAVAVRQPAGRDQPAQADHRLDPPAGASRPAIWPRPDRVCRVAHRRRRQAGLARAWPVVAADPGLPARGRMVRLARAVPHGREKFLGAELDRGRAELCVVPRSLAPTGRAAVCAQGWRRATRQIARDHRRDCRDSGLPAGPGGAVARLAAYPSVRLLRRDRIPGKGRGGGARQQRGRDLGLSRHCRPDLGLRRRPHGAAAHAPQIRRAAEGSSHLAHRPPVRHPRGGRALRLSPGKRPVGPARQCPPAAPAQATRGDRRQAAVRHHPHHRRHDRRRPVERMGRGARCPGRASLACRPRVDAAGQSRPQYRRPFQSGPHGPAHQPGPALTPIAHPVGHERGSRRSRSRGRPRQKAPGRNTGAVPQAAPRRHRPLCRHRPAGPLQRHSPSSGPTPSR